MDVLTIKLIEDKINIPLDLLIFINSFMKFELLTDHNIHSAVDLWCDNKHLCIFKFGHISNWNTIHITDMSYLFQFKTYFNDDISSWDVSHVTNMSFMFYRASSFNQPLHHWNVINVTNMFGMFAYASQFNQPLDQWNVINVIDMSLIFDGASNFNFNHAPWYHD